MMLSICSAAPASSSHLQIPLHAGARVSYSLRKAVEDGRSLEDRPFCLHEGIHVQDTSLSKNATRIVHSLAVERPETPGSVGSSIFSPFPDKFDDIVRGLPKEFTDKNAEGLSCSAGEENRLYPILAEKQDLPDSVDQGLATSISSGSSMGANGVTPPALESPVAVTDTADMVNNGLSNFKESIGNFLSGVTETVDTSIDRTQAAMESSYNSVLSSLTDAVKSVTESFDNAVSGLVSSAGSSREQTSNELVGFPIKLKENLYGTGSLAVDVLRRSIIIVEDSLSNAAKLVVSSYGSTKSLLPADFQNTLNISEEKATLILKPVGDAFQQIYIIIEGFERNLGLNPSDPVVPFLLFLGSSATIGISYWLFTYGGYSGDLTPELTEELLKNEKKAVLIDVRPEDLRKRDGIPDLRRAARSKYASVTLPELDSSTRKLLRSGKDFDDALTAVVIRNLKLVKGGSKVIVMDASGDRSKAIARSLKRFGVKNAYLVQGGFRSWVRKGLRIKELKPETALTVLNEEAEAILEAIKPTPTLLISYGLGIIVAGYALTEWEKTLQIIGILGLVQTLYRRFAAYEDSDDFKQDVRLLLAPVRLGAQAVSWAAGRLEPSRIGLPTSPSSTSVQDRVLKAAAKHESQPFDANDKQGIAGETSSQPNENLDLSEA